MYAHAYVHIPIVRKTLSVVQSPVISVQGAGSEDVPARGAGYTNVPSLFMTNANTINSVVAFTKKKTFEETSF